MSPHSGEFTHSSPPPPPILNEQLGVRRHEDHSRFFVVGAVLLGLAVEIDQLDSEQETGNEEDETHAKTHPEAVLQSKGKRCDKIALINKK